MGGCAAETGCSIVAHMPLARITRVDHLIVLIPYVLGYHPRDCLVLFGLRGPTLGVIQAIGWAHPWRGLDAGQAEALVSTTVRDGCDGAFVIAYDDHDGRRRAALDEVTVALTRAGLDVPDRLMVGAGHRWRSIDCHDPCCCPAGGRVLPGVDEVPAVAEWVLRGVDPYRDRAAMAASVEPSPGAACFDFAGLAPVRPTGHAARRAWAAVLGLEDETAVAQIGAPLAWQAVAAAAVPALRDEILQLVCPGILGRPRYPPDPNPELEPALGREPGLRRTTSSRPAAGGVAIPPMSGGDSATVAPPGRMVPRTPYDVLGTGVAVQRLLRRLTEFARRLPEPDRADTLAMTAVCAWWYGHGVLTRICLDRTLQLAPGHSLGVLLEALLNSGVRPRQDFP